MVKSNTFHCSVITPEKAVLECDATSVVFPAHDGEMGVLLNRAPLLCKMGIGALRVETAEDKQIMFVDGGFAQVVDNRLTILTEQAKTPDEIDRAAAEAILVEVQAMKITDEATYIARDKAIQRSKVQLKLTKKQ
ncbi:MAG: ATP synthase F1 subunit epsilon [Phycisphaerales bacterium]|nr:MAG: ATP synthase F1 subunit epsilon [Phycisphaerales bacterium]